MLYRHVFDKISTEFRGILCVFVNFAALRRREISEALTTSCIIYTNWRLKIYIWRLHFSSWSPKGDLRIFLISSLALIWTPKGQNQLSALQRCPYYRGVCKERLDCIFFLDSIKYITKWGKNILYIYLICFGVTYKKIFLSLLTEQN